MPDHNSHDASAAGASHDNHEQHDKHAGHSPGLFRRKFWLSLALTIPAVAYSHTIMDLLGYRLPDFPGNQWLPAVLGTVVFIYGGLIFIKGARAELAARAPGMMTLISMAISVAFGYSLAVTLGLVAGMDFWWEVSTLITIMLLGHWLEMASVMSAQGALKALAKLLPDEAEVVRPDGNERMAVAAVRPGDLVLVRPGASVPVDGEVIKGTSDVSEALLTGESKPITKRKGAEVIAGSLNGSGALTIRTSRTGDTTALSGIMRLVEEAQASRSRVQILADRAAFYLTFIALGTALLTLLAWLVFSDRPAAFVIERVVTVLVIACPHALGLAVPLVTAIATTKAAQAGLLVRERLSLESARNVDIVLFDKTGTLTRGEQGVVNIVSTDGSANDLLALAAAVEAESEHPIARAIVAAARERRITVPAALDFSALAGRGARARVQGKTIFVGGPRLVAERDVAVPEAIKSAAEAAGQNGQTVMYVIQATRVRGALMLADVIRPESAEAVRALHRAGKRVAMLTGDAQPVAQWVGRELGIDEIFAEVLPEHKADVVTRLQHAGSRVAMVGDGVNDAPALAAADVGIAIGAGTDVAIESAGIILAGSDPRSVVKLLHLSRATYRKMVQNLAWATGYNAVALPLAAGVTMGVGFVLSPAIGAVLMSVSTIVVAINAQLLRRIRL